MDNIFSFPFIEVKQKHFLSGNKTNLSIFSSQSFASFEEAEILKLFPSQAGAWDRGKNAKSCQFILPRT